MKYTAISISTLVLGVSWGAYAQAAGPTRVGIIHIQNAIISTKDGQKAAKDLQDKFAPTRSRLEKKQADVEADRAKLNQGSNAMSAEQKEKLMRDIDQKTKALNRDTEDAQAELDQEQSKIMQELGQRIYAVIDKYSKDKGYSLILDVSSQQTPVLFASNDIDITSDIVKLYDQNAPGAGTSSGPATHSAPAPPKPTSAAPPKPTLPAPPVKKTP